MLDPTVKQHIQERHQQMTAEGKLLSRPQLDQFYRTFRDRFGPEKLAGLDGEVLLETMHGSKRDDSLVYWLEFKNDEEFRSPQFGGIGGGYAFVYGVFRRKETETWVTAGEEKGRPRDLTVDEAVAIARRHRDQLIRGAELLQKLPANGSDDDYRLLQEALDRNAPDVSNSGWVHKYFSLLFPDKVDGFHNPDWQTFHLLKLLQLPPDGNGRYLPAGRFVAAGAELAMPQNHLMHVLHAVNGKIHKYWRVETSDGKGDRNRWDLMKDENLVAAGWTDLPDLSFLLGSGQDGRDRLMELLTQSPPSQMRREASQLMKFVVHMSKSKGDIVLAANGATILGIGRIVGDYFHDGSQVFPHRRQVRWLSLDEWKLPDAEGLQTTVYRMKKAVNLLEVERRTQEGPKEEEVPPPPIIIGPGPTPRLPGVPGRIQAVLDRKSQVILYGPPGTGKTYWAERTATDLAAYGAFGKPFEGLADAEAKMVLGEEQGQGLVRLCCFHPAYGYEDFIEGYRPETIDGQITFRLRDGIFKQACRDAAGDPTRNYFLIVDEINRGDIPRIFGELLTVLEKDKRNKRIALPVSGESFRVPPNLFLIGTMNTADRSISLLDAALRRRFGFVELMPDSAVLGKQVVQGIPLGPWLDALNVRICRHVGRDARNLQIGHSYLLQGGRPVKDLAAFRQALRDDILPLLEEYCYEDFPALQNILGNGLLDLEGQRLREELFEESRAEQLVQALLEPCTEITTSSVALASEEEAEGAADEADLEDDEAAS